MGITSRFNEMMLGQQVLRLDKGIGVHPVANNAKIGYLGFALEPLPFRNPFIATGLYK